MTFRLFVYLCVAVCMVKSSNVMAVDTVSSPDCLRALFTQAGVQGSNIQRYVASFRANELHEEFLFGWDFPELVSILSSPSVNISNAGDMFRIYNCVSRRGRCVVSPFCRNGGRCEYDQAETAHRCSCPSNYGGDRCEERMIDRIGRVEQIVQEMAAVTQTIGVTYTRWGKSSCNDSTGAELVYTGYTAGQYYEQPGGGSNYICLTRDPLHGTYQSGTQNQGRLYGTEYETLHFGVYANTQDQNAPCSVCRVTGRSTQIIVQGRNVCPPYWTLEYHGYIMSAHLSHKRTEFVCVDHRPDVIRGKAPNTNGALLYFVEVACGYGLDCPPFDNEKELTCAVCTR